MKTVNCPQAGFYRIPRIPDLSEIQWLYKKNMVLSVQLKNSLKVSLSFDFRSRKHHDIFHKSPNNK